MIVPIIVVVDLQSCIIVRGCSNFDLVVVRKMAFAGNVRKQVRDVAEVGFLWTNAAVQWQLWSIGRHVAAANEY